MTDPDATIHEIFKGKTVSISDSFSLAQKCSAYLRSSERTSDGRTILVTVLDNWSGIPKETIELWTDLLESAGFYPYLEKDKSMFIFNNTAGQIRKELHTSANLKGTYFHEEQKILNDILKSERNLIVSAPTSFGKSLLIEEIVASKKYSNIVIIQPTLALIDETRRKLIKYRDSYKVIVRTSQTPSEQKGNIFLFTAERVMEYKNFTSIDFFVIDEFYKLSSKRDDERSDVLNNAFHFLTTKYNPKFYLSGPNIDGISNGFTEKYNAVFYKTEYSLIGTKFIDMYSADKEKFDHTKRYPDYKKGVLFELLFALKNQQSIIYCSSPEKARKLALDFCNYLQKKGISGDIQLPLTHWIKQNISEKWSYISCLEYGIAVHDGALQRHITSSVIDYFNNGALKYLFCTSTIIEGVNTSAKNIIIFDSTKGPKKIDYFDYANIQGRSGRMMVHYVGNVYNFIKQPDIENIIIDIPFFDQEKLTDEVLINLDEEEIKDKQSDQYQEIKKLPQEVKDLVRENGINVKGQLAIIDEITDLSRAVSVNGNNYTVEELLKWQMPNYDQLCFIFDLCWRYLKNSRESLSIYSHKQLAQRVMAYMSTQNIRVLLSETYEKNIVARNTLTEGWHKRFSGMSDSEVFDESIRDVFQLYRHWFGYKVPKWLMVMNQLQTHIFEKNGKKASNYSFFANSIENDFVQDNLRILLEYSVPKSAIDKLNLDTQLSEDEVLDAISTFVLTDADKLSEYELEKLKEAVGVF